MTPSPANDPGRPITNLAGESLGMTVGQYDATRPPSAVAPVHTLCHAPFVVMDLGPQGQVTTCNHFHRFIGNLREQNWLDIFRGEDWTRLRQNMLEYRISEDDCRHCARQIRSGHGRNAFAQEHFDIHAGTDPKPRYPTVIIFRLSNVCNLMCVMCNGTLSHRIRKEREKLPPLPPPPYDEQFFREMEETLPNVKYVEFYGGEPFLVQEHLRILDILERTGAKTEIYVNTNGTSLTPRIKGLIERLNFVRIAVSVDAVVAHVHERVRVGIKHDVCMANLQWLLDLRARKKLWIGLNTTETRFNWYHLPDIFRFAAEKGVYVHINTCLHPSDCTLYDLPTEELAYIDDYFERARNKLGARLQQWGNTQSYGHLQAMVRDELKARRESRKRPNPYPTDRKPMYGGFMSVPELGLSPFTTPADAREEVRRVQEFGCWNYARRMAVTWLAAIDEGLPAAEWAGVRGELSALLAKAEPLVVHTAAPAVAETQQIGLAWAWELEQQGRFAEAAEAAAQVPADSPHYYEAVVLRARAQRRAGQHDVARAGFDQALALEPRHSDAHVELAWLGYDTGDLESGLAHARRARELASNAAEPAKVASWAHVLGMLAVRAGNREEADQALHSFECAYPTHPELHSLRQAIQGMAAEQDRKAVQQAWRLEGNGDLAGAAEAIAAVPQASPGFYDALVVRARLHRRKGELEESRACLDQAMQRAARRPEAYVESAWLFYDRGEHRRGLEHARRVRDLPGHRDDPGWIDSWAHPLAALAVALGEHEDALDALRRLARVRGPERPAAPAAGSEADRALAADRRAVEQGWECERQGDPAGALRLADGVPPGSSVRYLALVLRARALRALDDFAKADAALTLAVAYSPCRPEALAELAAACRARDAAAAGAGYAQLAQELGGAEGTSTQAGAGAPGRGG